MLISSLSLEGTNKVCDGHTISTQGKLNKLDVKHKVNNIKYAQKRIPIHGNNKNLYIPQEQNVCIEYGRKISRYPKLLI